MLAEIDPGTLFVVCMFSWCVRVYNMCIHIYVYIYIYTYVCTSIYINIYVYTYCVLDWRRFRRRVMLAGIDPSMLFVVCMLGWCVRVHILYIYLVC